MDKENRDVIGSARYRGLLARAKIVRQPLYKATHDETGKAALGEAARGEDVLDKVSIMELDLIASYHLESVLQDKKDQKVCPSWIGSQWQTL